MGAVKNIGRSTGLGALTPGSATSLFDPGDLLGTHAAGEAADAAKLQEEQAERALQTQREANQQARVDVQPFREAGAGALPLLQESIGRQQELINDPGAGVLNNPFFQALAGQQEQRLLASQAARGKVGSGGTGDQLQRNLLLLGNQFSQQNIANQQGLTGNFFNLATLGANAASQQATQTQQGAGAVGGILGQLGNAQAAGIVGPSNVRTQSTQGIVSAIPAIASSFGFSDQRLKQNIKFSHVENNINIYTWNWTKEGKLLAGQQQEKGPIAQELMIKRPDLVVTDPETGYLKVLM